MPTANWLAEREGVAVAWALVDSADPQPASIVSSYVWTIFHVEVGSGFTMTLFWATYDAGANAFDIQMFDGEEPANEMPPPRLFVVDGSTGEPGVVDSGVGATPLAATGVVTADSQMVSAFEIDVPDAIPGINGPQTNPDRDAKLGINNLFSAAEAHALFFQKSGNSGWNFNWDGGGEGFFVSLEFAQLPPV